MKVNDSRVCRLSVTKYADFISEIDLDFINPLIERDYFEGYINFASKLIKKGITFFIVHENELIAASTCYADPEQYEYAHVPFTGIRREWRGKGISSILLESRNRAIKALGMKGVISSCAKSNERMRKSLERANFKLICDEAEIKALRNSNNKDDWDKVFYKLIFNNVNCI